MLTPAPQAAAADDNTFTVALTDEVDSLNPFLGVLANSYEMWALTYNFMIGYSMNDMSPQPELATKWETSPDGKTWTFHIRDDVKWTDGQQLTAADIAYTYNRVLHGTVEANNWSSYLNNVTSVTAPDAGTVVLKLSKPNAVLPLLPIPIVPEHIWKNVSEKAMKSFGNAPTPGHPIVGSGPYILEEGKTGGSTFKFVANKNYWGGAPARRPRRLPGVQEHRPRRAGADQGRGRLRRRHHRAAGAGPQGQGRHHRGQQRLAVVRGDRVQHRCGRHQDRTSRSATPTRPCWTRSSGTRSGTPSTSTAS